MFAAVPITYQQYRGWSAGIAGLAFVVRSTMLQDLLTLVQPIGIGMLVRQDSSRAGFTVQIGAVIALFFDARYTSICDANDGLAPPEARLPMGALGAWFLPIGLLMCASLFGSD